MSGVELTRYPPGLISALEKLRGRLHGRRLGVPRHGPPLDRAAAGRSRRRRAACRGSTASSTPIPHSRSASRSSASSSPTATVAGAATGNPRRWRPPACWLRPRSPAADRRASLACRGRRRRPGASSPAAATKPRRPTTTATDDHGGDHHDGAPAASPRSPACPATTALTRADRAGGEDRQRRAEGPPAGGLNQADVVYEERVEGSVTRLLAIFQSTDAAPVGPVRSARTSDIGDPGHAATGPYFAWSGANTTFAGVIRQRQPALDVGYDRASGRLLPRAGDRPRARQPHAEDDGRPSWPSPTRARRRRRRCSRTGPEGPARCAPRAGRRRARSPSAPAAGAAPVDWRLERARAGPAPRTARPHVDAAGVQVAPANVIVQFVPYASSGVDDQFGEPIPRPSWSARATRGCSPDGGSRRSGRWHKPALDAVTTYTDVDGNPILPDPGPHLGRPCRRPASGADRAA